MSVVSTDKLRRLRPSTTTLAWGALVVNAELLLVLTYLVARGDTVTITRVEMLVLPFVWINVGLWAVLKTRPLASSRRKRVLAGGVGLAYFAVLAVVGGLVSLPGGPAGGLSLSIASVPPGWGPYLFVDTVLLEVTLLPFKLVGYLALAYLVYATALEASSALLGGVVGLFSCVSCTLPVISALLTGVAGSGTALATFASANSYLLSTAVFVVTVGLLYWRPVPR